MRSPWPHTRSLLLAAALVSTALCGTQAAAAEQTKEQCVAADEAAQPLRRSGKLRDARALLLQCIAAECPRPVRDDCAQRLGEVDRALPTVVFVAEGADGAALTAVHVTVDGVPLAEQLDGTALPIDPGEHTFAFKVDGRAPIEKWLVIRESEKERRERVAFVAPPPPTPAAAPAGIPQTLPPTSAPAESTPSSSTPSETASTANGQRIAAYVLGGAGVVCIGVGGAFGLSAASKWSQAKIDCGSGCSATSNARSEKSDADTAAAASTGAFIAGAVEIAAGVIVFLTAPSGEKTKGATLRVVPSVGPSGGGVLLSGKF